MSAITEFQREPTTSLTRQLVIGVHGSASTGGQWRRLAEALGSHYEMIAPDLPGYGKQHEIATVGTPSLNCDGAEVSRLVREATAPVHIVAHSYGGAVALKVALDHPTRVASLTLIEPALFHLLRTGRPDDMVHYTEIAAIANAVRLAVQCGQPAQGMACFVDYWNGPGTWAEMKPSLQTALTDQTKQVARNFAAAFGETWDGSMCRRIQSPTLVITAANSRGPAQRVAEIVADAIPCARLATIADAGHMVPVTHPKLVNPLIAKALDAAGSGRNETSHREAA